MTANSPSPLGPEQPRDDLQLRWTRQCSALHACQDELLKIGSDLTDFAEVMRGQKITAQDGEATAQFEELQKMKEDAVAALDQAVGTLEQIASKAGVSLPGELTRFQGVRDRLREIDLSQIPSGIAFEPDFQAHVHNFVGMQDNTPEGRVLQQALEADDMRRLRPAMSTHAKELTTAAEQVRTLSVLLTAAREQARTMRNQQLSGKIGAMQAVYDKAVRADRFTGKRDESVDVAPALRMLKTEIGVLQKGNRDFVTAPEYRQLMGSVCNKAYKFVDTSGYRFQLERENAPRSESPVTAEATVSAGGTSQRRGFLAKLFGRR